MIQVDDVYHMMFQEILPMMGSPEESRMTSDEFMGKIRRIKNGLEVIFGNYNDSVIKLRNWIMQSDGMNRAAFTVKYTIETLREIFPYKVEVAPALYSILGLEKWDKKIKQHDENSKWRNQVIPSEEYNQKEIISEEPLALKRPAIKLCIDYYQTKKAMKSNHQPF